MFQGINAIAQIILSSGVIIILIIIFLIIFKRGIKVGYNKGTIQIGNDPEKKCSKKVMLLTVNDLNRLIEIIMDSMEEIIILTSTEKLNRKMLFTEKKIANIKKLKDESYLKIIESKGKEASLYEDSLEFHYFQVMIACMIYVDDDDGGILGFKNIIKKELKFNSYDKEGTEYEEYIQDVISIFVKSWKRALKIFHDPKKDDSRYTWIVSYDDLKKLSDDPEHMRKIETIIREIFAKAKDFDEEIKQEKNEADKEREQKIADYFAENNNNNNKKE